MPYLGYRIKINGQIVPEGYIAKGSYSIEKAPRVAEKWTDGRLVDHISMTEESKVVINLSIREHNSAEHTVIMGLFANRYSLSVEYYDDDLDRYIPSLFHIDKLKFAHLNVETASSLSYAVTPITLEEF